MNLFLIFLWKYENICKSIALKLAIFKSTFRLKFDDYSHYKNNSLIKLSF